MHDGDTLSLAQTIVFHYAISPLLCPAAIFRRIRRINDNQLESLPKGMLSDLVMLSRL